MPDPTPATEVLRLQRAAGNQAVGRLLARHPVATTPINRRTREQLFGDGTPGNLGLTLSEFVSSTRSQADWFVEPTLTDADRDDLWALLRRASQGAHVLAGVGDLRLAELRTATAGDWINLEAFGRACHAGSDTVRVLNPAAYTMAQRIGLGETLLELEQIIPPEVLRLTVSEVQLADVRAHGLIPAIRDYWATFQPHLQRRYTPGPGARGLEFQGVIDLLLGPGFVPFTPLLGRIRNLHRFSVPMLIKLMVNFADVSRARPVHLVLYTGHDESSFQQSNPLFEDLVLNSPNNVLVLEGQAQLADITAAIPTIAATYGQPDASGTPRIAQAMIAGHGQARSIELAGTGPAQVVDEQVRHPSESLDLDRNAAATNALLNTLLSNLDPATARVVFAGCLVGSNPVPAGTPTAAIPGHIAATPSLATHTEQLGAAHGLAPGFTQAARASVGLGAATSLMDAGGNLAIQYPFDPNAFGDALTYVATGHEPEGVLVAAVEVAATAGPLVAETQLRTRLAAGADPGHGWYDEFTIILVAEALNGVAPGTGVDVQRLNTLAHMAQIPFLVRWPPSFGITAAHLAGTLNAHPAMAGNIYAGMVATPTFSAPGDDDAQAGRVIIEQAWMALPAAREAALLAFLAATPAVTAEILRRHLDTALIGGSSPTLFPVGAPVEPGRIRLALGWLKNDPNNADVRAYLDAQVVTPAGGAPELSPAVRAELGGFQEDEILETLGRLLPTVAPPAGGPPLPAANAEIGGTGDNRVLIEPKVYEATVTATALNVRTHPHMGGAVFKVVRNGDVVRVAGFTHNWAGIDVDGRLGFVHRNYITPPPP